MLIKEYALKRHGQHCVCANLPEPWSQAEHFSEPFDFESPELKQEKPKI